MTSFSYSIKISLCFDGRIRIEKQSGHKTALHVQDRNWRGELRKLARVDCWRYDERFQTLVINSHSRCTIRSERIAWQWTASTAKRGTSKP